MITQLNKDAHEHRYTGYRYQPVVTDNKRYPGGHKDWAFILSVCKCDATKPLEYGRKEKMQNMYMEIKRRFTA